MEIIREADVALLSNSGVSSRQLISPENSRSERVTITRVSMAPGAKNPPHRHLSSEQVWVALSGEGTLLLENGKSMPFVAGDVVRFADNDLHGLENTGGTDFEYIAVTSPPVNFRAAYAKKWK